MSNQFGIKSVTPFVAAQLLKKSSGCCAICGRGVNIRGTRHVDWNIDHFIPKAVAKWSLGISDQDLRCLRDLLSDDSNMFVVHPWCNEEKGMRFSSEDVSKLHLDKMSEALLYSLLNDVSRYLNEYNQTMTQIRECHGNKCANCGCEITSDFVIRRQDQNLPRSVFNSVLLCATCNRDYKNNTHFDLHTKRFI